jgi:hypothetical protein
LHNITRKDEKLCPDIEIRQILPNIYWAREHLLQHEKRHQVRKKKAQELVYPREVRHEGEKRQVKIGCVSIIACSISAYAWSCSVLTFRLSGLDHRPMPISAIGNRICRDTAHLQLQFILFYRFFTYYY